MTELAHRETSSAIEARQGLTREQVEIVKRTVAQGTNDDELALFLETARRRGLDPFSGQIHAIMRWDGRAGREVMKIQTGIDGYRSIANRTGLIDYVQGPEWTDDGSTWVDVWLREDPPAAARFTVKRKDRTRPETRVATWMEYRQTNRQGELTRAWRELGPTMIGKVAEAAALRAAFPDELGGIYTAEEMDQASTPEPSAGDGGDPAPASAPDPQAEEREELGRRFGLAWRDLGAAPERRNALWSEISDRLRGNVGDLRDAFAATPVHVLAEIVEQVETAAGIGDDEEGDDDGGDEGGAPAEPDGPAPDDHDDGAAPDEGDGGQVVDVCDGCGAAEDDEHARGCPVEARERELGETLTRDVAIDAQPDDPFPPTATEAAEAMEDAATEARRGSGRTPDGEGSPDAVESQVATLERLYGTMNVVEVSSLLRQGFVNLSPGTGREGGGRVELDDLSADERSLERTGALLLVEALERQHHGDESNPAGRRTVTGALESAGLTPQTRRAWEDANAEKLARASQPAPEGEDTREAVSGDPDAATRSQDPAPDRPPLPEGNTQANRRTLAERYDAAYAQMDEPTRIAAERIRRDAGPWTAGQYPDLVRAVREAERMLDNGVPF